MQRVTSQPLKMPTVWASGATAGFIRPVPIPSQIKVTPGAASYTDGFPPLNFIAVAAGGVPPFGSDMNGVLNQVTAWQRWAQAGGPIRYDASFQAQIGGYPAEARVGSNTIANLVWQSTADNNLSNPDAGGGGWQTPVFADPNIAAFTVSAGVNTAQSSGAGFAMFGNTVSNPSGAAVTAPKKWVRVTNGDFQIINNAYTAVIFGLSDLGDIYNIRNLTAGGTVSASVLTATNGASVGGAASVGSLHVTATPTTALISGNALQVDGHANVNGQIVAGQGIYAGNFFSPNADRGREWQFSVDPSAGHKFQVYRAHWYDFWNGSNGARSWVTSYPRAGVDEITAMSLDPAGNLFTNGQVLATTGIYAGTYFSPHAYNGREWNFQVDGNGSKYQTYRARWFDVWDGTNGTRSWQGDGGVGQPSRVLMLLDGSGNLSIPHQFTAETARLAAGATGTNDASRVTILNDFILAKGNPGYHIFPSGLIIQFGVVVTSTGNGDLFNFPIAFPNVCIAIVGTDDGSGMADIGLTPWPPSPRGTFIVWAGFNNGFGNPQTFRFGVGVYYIAIGY